MARWGGVIVMAAALAGCGASSTQTGTNTSAGTSIATQSRPAIPPIYDYTCGQIRKDPKLQYRLFAYVAAQENGAGSLYTMGQAEHIARNVTEDLCTNYGADIYPWNPHVPFDKGIWDQAYSGGVSPDDPGIQGPLRPIGNCNSDPNCQ
jgi:hypothetical protein